MSRSRISDLKKIRYALVLLALALPAGLGGCAGFQKGFEEGLRKKETTTNPFVKAEYYGPTTSGHTVTQVMNASPRITKEGILILDMGDVRIPASPTTDKMQYLSHFAYDPQTGIVVLWTGKATGKSPDLWNLYFYVVTDPQIERILNSLAANPSSVTTCNESECEQIIQSAGGWDSIFSALVKQEKANTIYCAEPIPYKNSKQRVQDMWRMVVELFWSPAGVPANAYNPKDGKQKPYAVVDGKRYKLGQRPDQDVFLYNFGQGSTRMAGNSIIAQVAPEYFVEKNGALTIKNFDAEKIAVKLRSPQAIEALKNLLAKRQSK